jgi:sec-independent protein translocase protein TatA
MTGAMQPWHWIVLLVVVLLLFGSTRLPGLAKSVGQSMKIFKKEIKDMRDDKPADGDAADGDAADGGTNAPTGTAAGSTTGSATSSSASSPTDKGGDAPKA